MVAIIIKIIIILINKLAGSHIHGYLAVAAVLQLWPTSTINSDTPRPPLTPYLIQESAGQWTHPTQDLRIKSAHLKYQG